MFIRVQVRYIEMDIDVSLGFGLLGVGVRRDGHHQGDQRDQEEELHCCVRGGDSY